MLEHAIVRYRDAASVDLIAERVTPRRALWIAAALGDVAGVRSFIAGKGRLTPEGRLNRPDLMAMGALYGGLPPNQDADDLEIMWEAFWIAVASSGRRSPRRPGASSRCGRRCCRAGGRRSSGCAPPRTRESSSPVEWHLAPAERARCKTPCRGRGDRGRHSGTIGTVGKRLVAVCEVEGVPTTVEVGDPGALARQLRRDRVRLAGSRM